MASLHESCPEWTRSIHGQGGLSAIYGFAAIDRRSVQYVGFKNFVAENAIFAWSGIGP
jgi:hypothetical protein